GSQTYRQRAEEIFQRYGEAASKNPFGFSHLLAALEFVRRGPSEIVLAGGAADAAPLAEAVHRVYLPARVLALAEHVPLGSGRERVDGRAAAYVCRNQTCEAPVTSADALARALA